MPVRWADLAKNEEMVGKIERPFKISYWFFEMRPRRFERPTFGFGGQSAAF
jgi:hypothetical protein